MMCLWKPELRSEQEGTAGRRCLFPTHTHFFREALGQQCRPGEPLTGYPDELLWVLGAWLGQRNGEAWWGLTRMWRHSLRDSWHSFITTHLPPDVLHVSPQALCLSSAGWQWPWGQTMGLIPMGPSWAYTEEQMASTPWAVPPLTLSG